VVTRNLSTDSCWPVSTNPKANYNCRDRPDCNRRIPLWQLVRASTAAPSFFHPETIMLDGGDGSRRFVFEDGGLTAHNNPAMKLFQMATLPEYRVGWPSGERSLLVVSIGTGLRPALRGRVALEGDPLHRVAKRAPSDLMRGFSTEIDLACRVAGRCVAGPVIDREVGDLISRDDHDCKAFTYARYDADLSPEGLAAAGVNVGKRTLDLDSVWALDELKALGRKTAEAVDVGAQFHDFC
jgi:uncharacterized protein